MSRWKDWSEERNWTIYDMQDGKRTFTNAYHSFNKSVFMINGYPKFCFKRRGIRRLSAQKFANLQDFTHGKSNVLYRYKNYNKIFIRRTGPEQKPRKNHKWCVKFFTKRLHKAW